jgi:hypothetical protein
VLQAGDVCTVSARALQPLRIGAVMLL